MICIAGEIPETLDKLINLTELNLSGNRLSGELHFMCRAYVCRRFTEGILFGLLLPHQHSFHHRSCL